VIPLALDLWYAAIVVIGALVAVCVCPYQDWTDER